MNETKDEQPHFMKPDEDCMGNPTVGYWRQFLFCSDGRCVLGNGGTPADATKAANEKRDEHEKFLNSPARQRVKAILGKYRKDEYPLAQDQGDLLRAFAELLGCYP